MPLDSRDPNMIAITDYFHGLFLAYLDCEADYCYLLTYAKVSITKAGSIALTVPTDE